MAIEKIRFSQTDVTNANLLAMRPSNIDTTGAFPDLGAKILAAFEPGLKAEAQKQGTVAGSAVPVVKNEDGSYSTPPTPEAGTEYQIAFEEAMQKKYANEIYFDYSKQADQLMQDNSRDPEAFRAKAEGLAAGILKTVPPEIAASVMPALQREALQRYSGILSRKSSEERQLVMSSLEQQQTDLLQEAARLTIAGQPALAEEKYAEARDTFGKLNSLVGTNKAYEDAFRVRVETIQAKAGDLAEEEAQRQQDNAAARFERNTRMADRARELGEYNQTETYAKGFAAEVAKATTDQLLQVDRFIARNVAPGEVLSIGPYNLTLEEFHNAMPNTNVLRNTLGFAVNNEIGGRDRQAQIDRAAANVAAIQEKVRESVVTGIAPNSQDAKDLLDEDARQFRLDLPEGRQGIIKFSEETGYLPAALKNNLYIAARKTIDDPAQTDSDFMSAVNSYDELKAATKRDPLNPNARMNQGAALISQLDPETAAMLETGSVLKKTLGQGPSFAGAVNRLLASGATKPTKDQVFSRITDYKAFTNDLLTEAFSIDAEAKIPLHIREDFDNRFFLLAQVLDPKEAAAIVTTSLKNSYETNPAFTTGIGPKSFYNEFTAVQLNQYVSQNYPQLGFDFAGRLGEDVHVMLSRESTPGDPTYLFTVMDRTTATSQVLTIRRSQLPPYRIEEVLPQQKHDSVVAAAKADFLKDQWLAHGNFDLQQAATAKRDERLAAAAERLRIETEARQQNIQQNTPVIPEGAF